MVNSSAPRAAIGAPMADIRHGLVDLLLLLAPVVVVPLGFRLAPLTRRHALLVLRVARYAQPVGALGAVASFLVPIGSPAGVLAARWLGAGLMPGVAGQVAGRECRLR